MGVEWRDPEQPAAPWTTRTRRPGRRTSARERLALDVADRIEAAGPYDLRGALAGLDAAALLALRNRLVRR